MKTIFRKIIDKEIPARIVAEDENFLAFLDVNPLQMGHTLVIPKKEIDYIFDLEDDIFSELHLFSKKVAKKLIKAFPCKKIAVSVIGLEVAHAHIHLIPMNQIGDVNFSGQKLNPSEEELDAALEKIKNA